MRLHAQLLPISRVLFYLLIFSIYIADSSSLPMIGLYVISLAFFLATSAIGLDWWPLPEKWRLGSLYATIIWSGILAPWVNIAAPGGPISTIFVPLFVSLYFQVERRWLRPALLATTLFWLASHLPDLAWRTPQQLVFQIGIYGAFNMLSCAMGSLMRSQQESQEALEEAHRRVQDSAIRQQQLAVLEERQRLARELHDSVAHHLTALVVQVQAARRTLEQRSDQVGQRLEECEVTARQALQETRLAVRALHPAGLEQQSDLEALRRLARDFGAATGLVVSLDADQGALALPPDPNRLEHLYRIFQEALTNAHRHGEARSVTGQLALADGELTFTIANDGKPPVTLTPGLGLRSMAERAASLGGSISYEAGESGLRVLVTIPVPLEVRR